MSSNPYRKIGLWLTILFFAVLFLAVWAYNLYYQNRVGQEQPIAFSHRIHAGVKNISCFMCHVTAMTGEHAGIPPTETCLLCHRTVIIHHPEIERLRKAYFNKEIVSWIKITYIPDYVFFNHSVHIKNDMDCSYCHGNISEMDRVTEVQEFTMGFCLGCHKEKKVSIDCFTCHR